MGKLRELGEFLVDWVSSEELEDTSKVSLASGSWGVLPRLDKLRVVGESLVSWVS